MFRELDPLIASYLSSFFIPQVLLFALASLLLATLPPIVVWRRSKTKQSGRQEVSSGQASLEAFALGAAFFWALISLLYYGVFEEAFTSASVGVTGAIFAAVLLGLVDLVVLSEKITFAVTAISTLSLAVALALFSGLVSIQVSSTIGSGTISTGFPLPWYTAPNPSSYGCLAGHSSACFFPIPHNPISLEYLLYDTLTYTVLATLSILLIRIMVRTARIRIAGKGID